MIEKIAEANQLSWGCNKQEARKSKAKKISRHDCDHIVEETRRREALEPPDHEGMKKEHGKRKAQRLLKDGGEDG